MKNNSNIFERITYLADFKGFKNLSELAEFVGYKSAEKFYRLNRGGIAKPSYDMLEDISNKFENLNLHWLITGDGEIWINSNNKKDYTLPHSGSISVVSEAEIVKSLSPTNSKKLSPALSPTHNLGLPKVITILENTNEEVVSLVGVKAAAGYLNGYADPEYVSSLPTMRLPRLTGGTHRAFEAKGHSMNPTIHNNSIVIGRWVESLNEIRDRRIYVVVTKNEGIVIKRVLNRITETGNLILISDNQNKKEYPNIILDADEVTELWYLRGGLLFEFPEPNELHNRFNDLEAQVTIMQSQIQKMLK